MIDRCNIVTFGENCVFIFLSKFQSPASFTSCTKCEMKPVFSNSDKQCCTKMAVRSFSVFPISGANAGDKARSMVTSTVLLKMGVYFVISQHSLLEIGKSWMWLKQLASNGHNYVLG